MTKLLALLIELMDLRLSVGEARGLFLSLFRSNIEFFLLLLPVFALLVLPLPVLPLPVLPLPVLPLPVLLVFPLLFELPVILALLGFAFAVLPVFGMVSLVVLCLPVRSDLNLFINILFMLHGEILFHKYVTIKVNA